VARRPVTSERQGAQRRFSSRRRGALCGFTLIELAITLMVLAIAGAFVAPAVGKSLDGIRARTEIAGFAGYFRAAREQAVLRGEPQEVRLDPQARTLAILAPGTKGVRSTRNFQYLERIEADPPDNTSVLFQPQGFSTGGTFRILAPGNRRYVVNIDVFTGRVSTRFADS